MKARETRHEGEEKKYSSGCITGRTQQRRREKEKYSRYRETRVAGLGMHKIAVRRVIGFLLLNR